MSLEVPTCGNCSLLTKRTSQVFKSPIDFQKSIGRPNACCWSCSARDAGVDQQRMEALLPSSKRQKKEGSDAE